VVLCPGVDIWFGEVLLGPGRRSASWSGLRDFGKWQLFYWLGRSCRGVLELIVLFALLADGQSPEMRLVGLSSHEGIRVLGTRYAVRRQKQ